MANLRAYNQANPLWEFISSLENKDWSNTPFAAPPHYDQTSHTPEDSEDEAEDSAEHHDEKAVAAQDPLEALNAPDPEEVFPWGGHFFGGGDRRGRGGRHGPPPHAFGGRPPKDGEHHKGPGHRGPGGPPPFRRAEGEHHGGPPRKHHKGPGGPPPPPEGFGEGPHKDGEHPPPPPHAFGQGHSNNEHEHHPRGPPRHHKGPGGPPPPHAFGQGHSDNEHEHHRRGPPPHHQGPGGRHHKGKGPGGPPPPFGAFGEGPGSDDEHRPHHGGRHGPAPFGGRGGRRGPCGRGGFRGFGGGPGAFDMSSLAEFFQTQLFGGGRDGGVARATAATADQGDYVPAADIFDTESAYVIHVDLPGAKKEDVHVHYDAEKSEVVVAGVLYRPGDEAFLATLALDERRVGAFERKVRLGSRACPASVDAEGISARLEEGILRLNVPKVEKEFDVVRKIDVE